MEFNNVLKMLHFSHFYCNVTDNTIYYIVLAGINDRVRGPRTCLQLMRVLLRAANHFCVISAIR